MEEKNLECFRNEFESLMRKHGLHHASICGSADNGKFLGYIASLDSDEDAMLSTVNVGRLWQHARTNAKAVFDGFESDK